MFGKTIKLFKLHGFEVKIDWSRISLGSALLRSQPTLRLIAPWVSGVIGRDTGPADL